MKYGRDKDYKASQKDTTPLQMAYEFADAKMIEILEGKMEKSPLAMTVKVAIEEGEIEKVKKLLNDKPNNINELASIGWWLHTVASCQQESLCLRILHMLRNYKYETGRERAF